MTDKNEDPKLVAAQILANLLRRKEIQEGAEEFTSNHVERIVSQIFAEDVEYVLDEENRQSIGNNEREQGTTAGQFANPVRSLALQIEELRRGIISRITGKVADLQAQNMRGGALAFRRSQQSPKGEVAATEPDDLVLSEVVNWLPSDISSTVVGCQVVLVWEGKKAPSKSPNFRVLYDGEPSSFEEETKDATMIEISIDQPKPSRFVIDVSDTGEYVINLYSS